MNEATLPRATTKPSGAERRREKRYEIELNGVIRTHDREIPVRLSDMSASGALAVVDEDGAFLKAGSAIQLFIEDFETIESRIAHVGRGFYGISFDNAHIHRQRLKAWLLAYVGET